MPKRPVHGLPTKEQVLEFIQTSDKPAGKRGDKATKLVRALDDEWLIKRGEYRRQPVEPLRP